MWMKTSTELTEERNYRNKNAIKIHKNKNDIANKFWKLLSAKIMCHSNRQ